MTDTPRNSATKTRLVSAQCRKAFKNVPDECLLISVTVMGKGMSPTNTYTNLDPHISVIIYSHGLFGLDLDSLSPPGQVVVVLSTASMKILAVSSSSFFWQINAFKVNIEKLMTRNNDIKTNANYRSNLSPSVHPVAPSISLIIFVMQYRSVIST